jgi:hypothetical protein
LKIFNFSGYIWGSGNSVSVVTLVLGSVHDFVRTVSRMRVRRIDAGVCWLVMTMKNAAKKGIRPGKTVNLSREDRAEEPFQFSS